MRPDVEKDTHRLATKKLADKYIGRRGEPPSLSLRRAAARSQDLNDDDRKHLRWCLEALRVVARGRDVSAAFGFIEAILTRDYALDRGVEPLAHTDFVVGPEDPELFRHMMAKRSRP